MVVDVHGTAVVTLVGEPDIGPGFVEVAVPVLAAPAPVILRHSYWPLFFIPPSSFVDFPHIALPKISPTLNV